MYKCINESCHLFIILLSVCLYFYSMCGVCAFSCEYVVYYGLCVVYCWEVSVCALLLFLCVVYCTTCVWSTVLPVCGIL